mgnify:CR=1 FL=1
MYIRTDLGDIYYEYVSGDVPIVFIHGAGCNSTVFSSVVSCLGEGTPYLSLDLPLHGKSRGDLKSFLDSINSVSDYGDFILDLLKNLGIERFIVAGHSMGGAIVLDLLARNIPGILGGIVISSGAQLSVNPLIFDGLKTDFEGTVRKISKWAIAKGSSDEIYNKVLGIFLSADREVIYRDFLLCDKFDIRDRLKDIGVPTLVVVGSLDVMTPVSLSEKLSASIKNSRLEVIDSKGHMLPIEAGEVLASLVSDYRREILA